VKAKGDGVRGGNRKRRKDKLTSLCDGLMLAKGKGEGDKNTHQRERPVEELLVGRGKRKHKKVFEKKLMRTNTGTKG